MPEPAPRGILVASTMKQSSPRASNGTSQTHSDSSLSDGDSSGTLPGLQCLHKRHTKETGSSTTFLNNSAGIANPGQLSRHQLNPSLNICIMSDYSTNPFALGGWSNPHNPHSINENPENRLYANLDVGILQNAPPMFANHVSGPRPSSFSAYRFMHAAPPAPGSSVDLLSSAIVDAHGRACFYFTSKSHPTQPTGATTTMTDAKGATLALVEWLVHPFAKLEGKFTKQLISSILKIRSGTTIAMMVHNKPYHWVRFPGQPQMCFYEVTANPAELIAIVAPEAGSVTLSVSPVALQRDLLDVVVLSSALLLSGKRLD